MTKPSSLVPQGSVLECDPVSIRKSFPAPVSGTFLREADLARHGAWLAEEDGRSRPEIVPFSERTGQAPNDDISLTMHSSDCGLFVRSRARREWALPMLVGAGRGVVSGSVR